MYERLQENGRIIKRITNPKRDKLIQRSIEGVKVLSRPPTQAEGRSIKSEHHVRKPTWQQNEKQLSVNASQQKY